MEFNIIPERNSLQKKFSSSFRKKLRESINSKNICSPIKSVGDSKNFSFENEFIFQREEILTSNLLDEDLIRVFNDNERKMSKIHNKYNDNLAIFVNKCKENIEYNNKKFIENLPFTKKNDHDNISNYEGEKDNETENRLKENSYIMSQYEIGKTDESNFLRKREEIMQKKLEHKLKESCKSQIELEQRNLSKFGMVYDSFSSEDNDNQNDKTQNKIVFVIPINSRFKRNIDLISIILIFYSILVMPLTLCLQFKFTWIIDICIDMFFILGICISFFSQYKDAEDNVVNSHLKIFENYISKGFLLDLATSIPTQFFLRNDFTNNNLNSSIVFFTWVKFLRIFKLFEYHLVVDIHLLKESKLNSILKLSIIFFIFIHYSSCFWIFIGLASITKDGLSWVTGEMFLNSSYYDIYISSFYYHLVTVYSIGYGDITPVNIHEKIYVLFLLFLGTNFYSYIVSSLSILFGTVEYKKIIFNKKMKILNEIADIYNLNEKFFEEIKQNIHYELDKYNCDRYELLDSLPNNIKNELTSVMYKAVILKNNFFTSRTSEFISFVLPYLKSVKFRKNQIIVSSGEYLDEMYIVIKGSLRLGLGPKYNNLDIVPVLENEHFGELFLQVNTRCNYQISCKSKYAEVQSLKKNDYLKIKKNFPKEIFQILEISYSKMLKIDKRTIQFIKLFKSLNSQNEIYKLKRDLHLALMEKNFNKYYNHNYTLGNVDRFIENHTLEEIQKFIDKYKKRSNYRLSEIKRINSKSEKDFSLLSKNKSNETQIKQDEVYIKKPILRKKITKKQFIVKEIKEKVFPKNDYIARGEEAFNFKTQLLLNQSPRIYLTKSLNNGQNLSKSKNRFLSSKNLFCGLKLISNESVKTFNKKNLEFKIERVVSFKIGGNEYARLTKNLLYTKFKPNFKRKDNVKFKTSKIVNNNKILNQSIYINQLNCNNFSINQWDTKSIDQQILNRKIYETNLQRIEYKKLQKISFLVSLLKN